MRSSIAESITSTVKDLIKSGLVDEITMKNVQSLCVPAVKVYKPEKIVLLRKRMVSIVSSEGERLRQQLKPRLKM